MRVVVDASIILAGVLEETDARIEPTGRHIREEGAFAPALWWFEMRNGLIVSERRKRVTEAMTAQFLSEISSLPISIDRSPDEVVIITLARRHRLTVYDAAYLELALREGVPLATLDGALAAAARAEGVPVLSAEA